MMGSKAGRRAGRESGRLQNFTQADLNATGCVATGRRFTNRDLYSAGFIICSPSPYQVASRVLRAFTQGAGCWRIHYLSDLHTGEHPLTRALQQNTAAFSHRMTSACWQPQLIPGIVDLAYKALH